MIALALVAAALFAAFVLRMLRDALREAHALEPASRVFVLTQVVVFVVSYVIIESLTIGAVMYGAAALIADFSYAA